MPKKLTYEFVKNYIENVEGYVLLEEEYINYDTKMKIRCNNNHVYNTNFDMFYRGTRCTECLKKKMSDFYKFDITKVKQILKSLGYDLFDKEYLNARQKLNIIDKDGYKYFVSFDSIQRQTPHKFNKVNPYTTENLKRFLYLNGNNYNLLTDYIDSSNYMLVVDNEGYSYLCKLNTILNFSFNRFGLNNPFTIQNIKLWCKLNDKPFELLSDVFINAKTNLKWMCLKDNCGDIFYANWSNIYSGKGCSVCHGKQVGLSNCLATKNPELAKEWHPTNNGDMTPYDITCGSQKHAWWFCKKCGKEWIAEINSRNNGSGCSNCNKSNGENYISEIFNINNIKYIYHHIFPDCKYINPLEFDFYLPYYNTCIEYQGEQHYFPVDFAGRGEKWAEEQFRINQIRDQIKRDYCKDNNIKLIEIPYWDFDNIEKILKKELNLT